jgi:hypothetical protein
MDDTFRRRVLRMQVDLIDLASQVQIALEGPCDVPDCEQCKAVRMAEQILEEYLDGAGTKLNREIEEASRDS